jgi:subtilisin family serine protease
MAKIAIFSFACLIGIALANETTVINPSLMAKLKTQKFADVTITFKEGIQKVHDQIEALRIADSVQRITSLRSALIANAEASQRNAKAVLESKAVHYKSMWISNIITIRKADLATVQDLAKVADIEEIREMVVVPLEAAVPTEMKQGEPQWGVSLVRAPEIWARGNRGEGIIVSNVDTGVRGTHSILAANFLGPYGWYDPPSQSAQPRDTNGHGTHTMGTIAGQNGYGVAPGAKWMACIGCNGAACYEDDLNACGQFIACPHDTNGNNADCTKKPHVVGNSWGSSAGGQTWYDPVIAAWNAANIIVVFSAGNSGSGCNTVGSPGDRPGVIGVAATDRNDGIATFSSRGPPADGTQKPEIAAPGVDVLSAYSTSDVAFQSLSGTSMACPHVVGAVALLFNEKPQLIGNTPAVRAALFSGADKTGLGSSPACGGVDSGTFPNFVFGHGRLDVVGASA